MKQLLKYIFFGFTFLLVMPCVVSAFSLPADTLRQKKVNGIKVRLYKVQSKDTWTSISKKSKVSVAYLMTVNAGIDNLKAGQIINVPTEEGSLQADHASSRTEQVFQPTTAAKESKYQEPVYHTIKKGETLYRISKFYNQTLDNLKSWNNIKNTDLKVGQKIIVNYVYQYRKDANAHVITKTDDHAKPAESNETAIKITPSKPSTDNKTNETGNPEHFTNQPAEKLTASMEPVHTPYGEDKSNNTAFTKNANGRMVKQVNETGVASWIMDGEMNQNKYYALHRYAPVGTIIKVTNRMNGKYVFVKVVGLLPDTGDNDNLIIKISQAASNKINVLDSRFQAELSYGVAE